jgi:hypothetical protein
MAAGLAARSLSAGWELAVDATATVAFPVLLIVTGALPWYEVRRTLEFAAPWRRWNATRELRGRLAMLEAAERELIASLAVRRERPAEVATRYETSDQALLERFVSVLRRLGDVGSPSPIDHRIGAYLVSRAAPTRRDVDGFALSQNAQAVPLDVDRLTELVDHVRRVPPSTWRH